MDDLKPRVLEVLVALQSLVASLAGKVQQTKVQRIGASLRYYRSHNPSSCYKLFSNNGFDEK